MARALLEVSNPKFFDGLKPLQFVDTPSLQNTVVVFVRVASLHTALRAPDVYLLLDGGLPCYRAIPRAARAFAQREALSRVWNCSSTRSCVLSR